MSRFADYVQSKNLSVDRIFHCSARIERHRAEDRKLRLRREELRRSGKGNGYAEAGIGKPRSGRGVNRQHIEAAVAGQPLSSHLRAKLGRALAALAAIDGAAPPELHELFGDVQSHRHGSTPAPATEASTPAPAPDTSAPSEQG
jgi:hypothetical protein